MIDDKKIEAAARRNADKYRNYPTLSDEDRDKVSIGSFMDCAKWLQEEFWKDLLHPASEVPRNDNGKILAFSKVNSNMMLYDMNAMLNETTCNTYQEMWEVEVKAFCLTGWIYADELFDLIRKEVRSKRMKLKIKTHHALPCRTEVFTINGKGAEQNDFGDTYDHHCEDAEPYACADMHFDPKPPTEEVLNRYNITEEEYYNICNELECKLCVGSCGWCV